MKAQCERCKEIVPLEFGVEGEGIRVRCPACGEAYFVDGEKKERTGNGQPATGNRQPATGGGEPEMVCPKCGEGQRAAEACRKCGLVIANWDPERAEAEFGEVGPLRELWKGVEEEWGRAEVHDGFIEACRRDGQLAFAAFRYRQSRRDGSRERLAQILTLAEKTLMVVPRSAPPAKSRSRSLLLLSIVVIILALAWMLMGGFSVPE